MSLRPRGYRHRAVAGALSIAATLGLLGAIATQSPSPWVGPTVGRSAIEVRLLASTTPMPAVAPQTALAVRPKREQAADAGRRAPMDRTPVPRSTPQPLPITTRAAEPSITAGAAATPPERSPEGAPEGPMPAASAPLKLDPATLRAAAGQSKGQVQRLAEASGQDLASNATSQTERLGASVKNTAKPDCMTVGSSSGLFALPVIAYAVIKDQCR